MPGKRAYRTSGYRHADSRQPATRGIVLSEVPLKIGGLANLGFAFGIQKNVDEESHGKMAPRARFELATLRLTTDAVTHLSALSGVAYREFGAILASLVAPNLAPKR